MSEAIIDLRYLAESQPSLCIPRVFNNITEARIRQVFDELGLGKISRVDVKERKNEKGESFKRVYVHFEKWFWNEDAQAARRKLVSGKEIKIVYDNPWFWKVSASKWAPSGDSQDRDRGAPQRSRAHIDFDDSPRATDEFGRDLRLKRESDERRRPERRDDSRERLRPERRDDSRDNRRRDDRRPERREDSRDNRRRDNRRPEYKDERRTPHVPTLVRKSERPKSPVETGTPDCSPPRMREDAPDYITPLHNLKVDYGEILPMPKIKRRAIGGLKKNPVPVEIVEELVEEIVEIPVKDVLEEGEVVERYAGMSEEDKQSCEELYGDL